MSSRHAATTPDVSMPSCEKAGERYRDATAASCYKFVDETRDRHPGSSRLLLAQAKSSVGEDEEKEPATSPVPSAGIDNYDYIYACATV